jgi:hypothetical protein
LPIANFQPVLSPGPARVRLTDGAMYSNSAELTVSLTPGTPEIRSIFGLVSSESGPVGCRYDLSYPHASTTQVTAGQGILVSAYGIDTSFSTVVFEQALNKYDATAACAVAGPDVGVGAVVVVPQALQPGSATVQIWTTVNGFPSALSVRFVVTVRQ